MKALCSQPSSHREATAGAVDAGPLQEEAGPRLPASRPIGSLRGPLAHAGAGGPRRSWHHVGEQPVPGVPTETMQGHSHELPPQAPSENPTMGCLGPRGHEPGDPPRTPDRAGLTPPGRPRGRSIALRAGSRGPPPSRQVPAILLGSLPAVHSAQSCVPLPFCARPGTRLHDLPSEWTSASHSWSASPSASVLRLRALLVLLSGLRAHLGQPGRHTCTPGRAAQTSGLHRHSPGGCGSSGSGTVSFPGASCDRDRDGALLSLFRRTTVFQVQGPALVTSLRPNYFLEAPSPQSAVLGVRPPMLQIRTWPGGRVQTPGASQSRKAAC